MTKRAWAIGCTATPRAVVQAGCREGADYGATCRDLPESHGRLSTRTLHADEVLDRLGRDRINRLGPEVRQQIPSRERGVVLDGRWRDFVQERRGRPAGLVRHGGRAARRATLDTTGSPRGSRYGDGPADRGVQLLRNHDDASGARPGRLRRDPYDRTGRRIRQIVVSPSRVVHPVTPAAAAAALQPPGNSRSSSSTSRKTTRSAFTSGSNAR